MHKSPYHGFSVEFSEHRLYNSESFFANGQALCQNFRRRNELALYARC
jgi:hypothetical protein